MSNHSIFHQQFADDTQMYITVSVATALSNISRVEDCLLDLYAWFCCNGLVLNSDKSECILLGTVQRARTLPPIMHINAAGSRVPVSQTINLQPSFWGPRGPQSYKNRDISKTCRDTMLKFFDFYHTHVDFGLMVLSTCDVTAVTSHVTLNVTW